MRPQTFRPAPSQVLARRVRIGDDEEVPRDGSLVVTLKFPRDLIARRPICRTDPPLHQYFHGFAVGLEDHSIVCLGERAPGHPPDAIHTILCAYSANIGPLRWARQSGWIVPVEVLGKKERLRETKQQIELIGRLDGKAWNPRSPDI